MTKGPIRVTVQYDDERIKDDPLILEWCRAMERKLPKLLQPMAEKAVEEALYRHQHGVRCGDWHVLRAQFSQMDNDEAQKETPVETGHGQPTK